VEAARDKLSPEKPRKGSAKTKLQCHHVATQNVVTWNLNGVWICFLIYIFLCYSFFLFTVHGFKLRLLSLLSRSTDTWATSPKHFSLLIFEVWSFVYAEADLDWNPLIPAPCITWITGVCHHTHLYSGWDGVLRNFFPWPGLNLQFSQSLPPK
jgi:hypothetical protein